MANYKELAGAIIAQQEPEQIQIKGGANKLTLKADGASTAWTINFPAADGSNGQILSTDGNGNLSWIPDATGAGVGDMDTLTDVTYSGLIAGDILRYGVSGEWENVANGIADLNGVTLGAFSDGQVLMQQSGVWINSYLPFNSLSDVDLQTSPISFGSILTYNGSLWETTGIPSMSDQVLVWNGAGWNAENLTANKISDFASEVSTGISGASLADLGSKNINDLDDVAATALDGYVLFYANGGWEGHDLDTEVSSILTGKSIGLLSDVDLAGALNGDVLTWDGINWVPNTPAAAVAGGWTSISIDNTYTAVADEEYFCDTLNNGAWTLTLPASPSLGDRVRVIDYIDNFATNNLTVAGDGTDNINGSNTFVVSTNGVWVEFVYGVGEWRALI